MTKAAPSVATRDAIIEDRNFILATFLRGLYYGGYFWSDIPKSIFMEAYHSVLENLLSKPGVYVKVACLKDDPDVILGYAVLSDNGNTLHWVFTKSAWRGIGIAKSLVPETVTTVSHLTRVGLSMIKKRNNVVFNPFTLK